MSDEEMARRSAHRELSEAYARGKADGVAEVTTLRSRLTTVERERDEAREQCAYAVTTFAGIAGAANIIDQRAFDALRRLADEMRGAK